MTDVAIREVKDSLTALITDRTKYLEEIINAKNESIVDLQARVQALENQLKKSVESNVKLASRVGTIEQDLLTKIDDNEQRGRKMNLRIEGITYEEGETKEQLRVKVLETLNKMNANISTDEICRLHRSSKPRVDRPRVLDGHDPPPPRAPGAPVVRVAQTIIKFRHWGARERAYQAKFFSKEHNMREQIVVDLTKRCKALLDQARGFLGKKHPHAHVFADQECQLAVKIRTTDTKIIFNTAEELEAALARIPATAY